MSIVSCRRVGLLLGICLVGCAAPDDTLSLSSPPEPGTAVVNREPTWTRSTRWTMGRSPVVEIGGSRGSAPENLLKVAGVMRMEDGTVVVANASTGELRYFDAKGTHLRSVGGIGFERGTFRVLGWIQPLASGEIAAYDEAQRSLSVFDAEGSYVRRLLDGYDPRANGAFLSIEGVFDDESVLIHQSRMAEFAEGAQRSDDWWVRVPKFGLPVAVTGAFPGAEIVRRRFVNGGDISQPPFGRGVHAAIAPTRFYVGDDDRYAISAFSPEGALLHVVRLEGAERAITEELIDAYMDIRIQPNRNIDRRALEPPLRALITRKTLPAFSALRADPDGNLWVRDFDVALPADRRERWNVFDANGRYLGALEMPKAFAVMTIGIDYVAGVWKDRFGTERVRVYALEKPTRR
jgi:hypothetical protein